MADNGTTPPPAATPAGWYPDGTTPNLLRYWDGFIWTEDTQPASPVAAPVMMDSTENSYTVSTDAPESSEKKSKKFWVIGGIAAGVIVIGAIAGVAGGGSSKSVDAKPAVETSAPAVVETPAPVKTTPPAPAKTTPPPPAPVETPKPVVPEMTMGQKNAVASANDYLDYTNFSRTGLIEQLEYEGFATADAEFAVDKVTVDWNEQAAGSAKSYLEYTAFSRDGLIEQLIYEGFTPEQAEYGVTAVGY